MKKILLPLFFMLLTNNIMTGQSMALLLIDIQDFYFPGGKSALVGPEKAALNAAKLLDYFRKEKLTVIHIRHNSEPGGKINDIVIPLEGEKIITKDEVNCFAATDLLEYLREKNIDSLVICGMQTHMCVEAATRAGSDLGFRCILVGDACATKDLKYGERVIKADDVHYSTLATLRSYANVVETSGLLKRLSASN